MDLAEVAGEADWRQFADLLPANVLEGWKLHWRNNPTSRELFYDFFGNLAIKLAISFHSAEYAAGLTLEDFVYWRRDRETERSGNDGWDTPEDAEMKYLASRPFLKKSG